MTDRARELVALKPCPHGEEARIINIGGLAPYSIYLGPDHACHRDFGWFPTRDDAIEAWNARTLTPPEGDTVSEGVVDRVKAAIAEAPNYLGMRLDDELSDKELENAARAAIAALQSRVSPQEGLRLKAAAKALLAKVDADSSVRWKFVNECQSLRSALSASRKSEDAK